MGLFLFSALVHAYVGLRLVPALAAWPWAMVLVAATLVASALLMPMGLLARRVRSRRLGVYLAWSGLLFMGLFSSLFVLTLLRDVILAIVTLVQSAGWLVILPGESVRLVTGSALAVLGLSLAITALGFVNARRTAAVVTIDIPIADLPDALHGFTIAQISDIHVGPTIRRPYVEAIVEAVNRLEPDMVAVTGDLVDGTVAELREHVAPLKHLKSRYGTYFVTGNHEYYSGVHAWMRELERLDVRVLLNQHVVLQHGDAALLVAGVADPGAHHFDPSHRSDPRAALAGAPAHATVRVLLAHQPRNAIAAARAGFHLQLSGHTHGGQFFPWNYLIRWFQPFTAGLYRLEDLWLYTSRGTGYWGPPKRFGAPSEISYVRLVKAESSTVVVRSAGEVVSSPGVEVIERSQLLAKLRFLAFGSE